MHYKVKTIAALHTVLGGWPDRTRVEIDPGLGVAAHTVGDLRKVTAWPDNLAITTPPERHGDDIIRVTRCSVATRVAPKP
ncbi:MAG TPA: hypothetical protein VHA77_05380 [Xanthobacteraceae bacterium]|nr:hypothetical protein [Xanthobacteraceae bacterium]